MRTPEPAVRKVISAKDVYVGIDVHKESWHVTIRSDGEERFNGRIPGQYQSLKRVLERYRDLRIKVAYEAGPFDFWLLDRLVQDGIEAIVVPPSLIPIELGNKVKTDKRDSRKLATLLEKNMLKRVYVVTREEREHRDLLEDPPADRRPPQQRGTPDQEQAHVLRHQFSFHFNYPLEPAVYRVAQDDYV